MSQLGIIAWVYDYLGHDGHGLDHAFLVHSDDCCVMCDHVHNMDCCVCCVICVLGE